MNSKLAIPEDFQKIINDLLGTESSSFFESLDSPSPSSIRINPSKKFDTESLSDIPWSQWGKYLPERPVYTLDPSLHAGAYYVQEPSSMFLEQAVKTCVDLSKPAIALDLCAAPGGKSTHLLSLLHPDSFLVSNEVIRSRAGILHENILKWGYDNVMVTNNDPSHFSRLEGVFDLILVDAPCSGEGLFRKDSEAMSEWSTANIELCSLRQQRILKDVWPALKQNGILIFCTCTYNPIENEGTMEWMSKTGDCEFVSIPFAPEWGLEETRRHGTIGYRFFPHRVNGEGFFLSAIRKREYQSEVRIAGRRIGEKVKGDTIHSWINSPDRFNFIKIRELIHAVPGSHLDLIEFLYNKLNVILAGTPLATDKHGKLVPDHGAALSIHLNKSHFPTLELTAEQAIRYLQKEPLDIDSNYKGFSLITHKSNPIGWVNLLPNRINNLYPSNWRIRMRSK